MAVVTKHKLTKSADTVAGGFGADLFLGPLIGGASTLNGDDVLNGRGGVDRIKAKLVDADIAPVMKNIEIGIFSFNDGATVGLDLAHAGQMSSLFFNSADHPNSGEVDIAHAGAVSKMTVLHGSNDLYVVNGLDADATKTFALTVDGTTDTEIQLFSIGNDTLTNFDITLKNGADFELSGTAIFADNLNITSTGQSENYLEFLPGMHLDGIRNLTINGTQNITLYTQSDAFLHLQSFNSTAMTGTIWGKIGGADLISVLGGKGAEIIDIVSIGGTAQTPAKVSLGGGHDYLTLKYAFDAETQSYNGGSGFDTLTLDGAAADLASATKNFETVGVHNASGVYDVTGMALVNFMLFSTTTATSINGLADDATLVVYDDVSTFLTVNVADAVSSTTESMRLLVQNSSTVGSAIAGLAAASLTNLEIETFAENNIVYLGTVGSATDAASLELSGDYHFELRASNASTSYIQNLEITNSTGADISGLANGTQAFVSSGATITGGAGDDVLIGGAGADTISTGGGDNDVLGSLGADAVTLMSNSGLDTMVFTAQAQSAFGSGHDTVHNFNTFDAVDISALTGTATFGGNVADNSAGLATLSASHAVAFYNTSTDTLYVDLNHDQQLDATHDLQVYLENLATFSSSNLIS
jgi:hypothetical protein